MTANQASTQALRQLRWEQKRREVSAQASGQQAEIADTVAALQINGFPTDGFSAGHTGSAEPWAQVTGPNKPHALFSGNPNFIHFTQRYQDQEEAYRQVAEEHGVSLAQMMNSVRPVNELLDSKKRSEYWREADYLAAHKPETQDYKNWVSESHEFFPKLSRVVDGYNRTHQLSGDERLVVYGWGDGLTGCTLTFPTQCGRLSSLDSTPQDDAKRRATSQRTNFIMQDFGRYLRDRFIATGPINSNDENSPAAKDPL